MSGATRKTAQTVINLIVAVPALIALARQGADAGRAILDALKNRRA